MTAIFPSAYWSIVVMGIALEVGKLSSISFLHFHWKEVPGLIKAYLISAIVILMFINYIGLFGYLSKAHIEQQVNNSTQYAQVEIVQSKIDNETNTITDLDKQIAQIDNALQKLTDTGRAASSLAQAQSQRKTRDSLVKAKTDHLTTLDTLKNQKITAEVSNKKLEADFGPLKYIADAVYGNPTPEQMENIVRWIIFILGFVFDPLALCLLISAQFTLTNRKKRLTYPSNEGMITIDDSKL